MKPQNSFFSVQNLIRFIYAFSFLWLSSELLYGILASQLNQNGHEEFYYFIGFTRKPLVCLLNSITVLAWLIHLINCFKKDEFYFQSIFWQRIYQIGKVISILFIPITLYYCLNLIPFGHSSIRTDFLMIMQQNVYKGFVFIGTFFVFLCGLVNAFLWLKQLNITPRRPVFLIKLLTLIWAINLLYILFFE